MIHVKTILSRVPNEQQAVREKPIDRTCDIGIKSSFLTGIASEFQSAVWLRKHTIYFHSTATRSSGLITLTWEGRAQRGEGEVRMERIVIAHLGDTHVGKRDT